MSEVLKVELKQMFGLIRRWWWLLLLGPLLAGATAYGVSSRQRPMFAASAMLLVNQAQSTNPSDYNAVLAGKSLADTYEQLIRTWPVLQPVVADLALPYGVDKLRTKVSVSTLLDTRIIVVKVSDPDSAHASAIANAVGHSFSEYVYEQANQVSIPSRNVIDQNIADTKHQIDDLQRQNQTLEVRADLNHLQQTYGELLLTAQTMDLNAAAAKSQVIVAVPAVPPSEPYAPRVPLSTLLGLLPSLLITGGAAAVLEYLDHGNMTEPRRPRRRPFTGLRSVRRVPSGPSKSV